MSVHVRRSFTVLLAACLVTTGGIAAAQTEIEGPSPSPDPSRSPGLAEVALCQMPELGEPAGPSGLIGSIGGVPLEEPRVLDVAADGAGSPLECRLPTVEGVDALDSGGPLEMFATNDHAGDGPSSPGISRVLHTTRDTSGKEAGRILKDRDVLRAGKIRKKELAGEVWYLCVELEEELQPGDSVVIGTDVEGDPTMRAPSGVEAPDNPFSNVRDVYHVGRRSDGSTFAASTDLQTGEFFTSKRRFVAWLDGTNAYFVIPAGGLGQDFRVAAFRSGEGRDVAGLGASPRIPSDGQGGWFEGCVAHILVHEALELDEADYPSHGEVEFCFTATEELTAELRAWLDEFGDEDGVASGEVELTLRENERSVDETLPVEVFVDDDGDIYFTFSLGYSTYGYHAVEGISGITFPTTDDVVLDALFGAAARSIERALNPVSFAEDAGQLQGTERCIDADLQG